MPVPCVRRGAVFQPPVHAPCRREGSQGLGRFVCPGAHGNVQRFPLLVQTGRGHVGREGDGAGASTAAAPGARLLLSRCRVVLCCYLSASVLCAFQLTSEARSELEVFLSAGFRRDGDMRLLKLKALSWVQSWPCHPRRAARSCSCSRDAPVSTKAALLHCRKRRRSWEIGVVEVKHIPPASSTASCGCSRGEQNAASTCETA